MNQAPPAPPPATPPTAPEDPDGPSRRRAVPTYGVVGRIVGTVVVIALAAATVLIMDKRPMPSDVLHPFVTRGTVGKVVTTSTFKIRVDKPFVAKVLTFKDLSFQPATTLKTSGVWLVVPAAVQPEREPEDFGNGLLMSRSGKKYFGSDRIPDKVMPGGEGTATGIASVGVWAFEVPPDELPGSLLRVSLGIGDAQLEAEAWVDLGLGADAAGKALPTYDLTKDEK